MNRRIEKMLGNILNKKHHQYRQDIPPTVFTRFTEELAAANLSDIQRAARRLRWVLEMEKPIIMEDEKIVFMRTMPKIPEIFTPDEWREIKKNHYIHELGKVCNISPNYATTIKLGLWTHRNEAIQALEVTEDAKGREFLQAVIDSIDAVLQLTERYAEEAERVGNKEVAEILRRVPKYGATTFHEALQSFRILHFTLWASFNYHNTVGRFDQYMYPYLKADLDAGRLNLDQAFELLEEFFLTFNKDSDLYPGMQQGDNGQSMVLGGVDENGNDAYNILSEMCLKASLELKLIDPKINLRVNKKTDLKLYELGTLLTKQGLGFPQYSNDDVVIPGLLDKGYTLEDARNYVVAACWEFIIPAVGMDIPNIGALSYLRVVEKVIHESLKECKDFDSLMEQVKKEIQSEVDEEINKFKDIYMEPAPFMSILMDGCIKNARDISHGARYNNYGLHGTGLANAADSLAAIKKFVFEEKTVKPEDIINAINENYDGYEDLWAKLKYEAPKMGNDDDYVDNIAVQLVDMFANSLKDKTNDRGGCYRAGTGSAMYYVWHGKELNASPDGRKKGEFLSANYSPSLNIKTKGPVSIIRSFVKPNLKAAINGGPLTIEIHDTVFRSDENITKVAMLVKTFMDMGGHQLQINTLNKETLLEAQKKPELYRNLIVRVWGWSGYFVELDKEYQDHIIQRAELKI
ncbi:pyruvate formate-lyase [Biomaibacter acetigenes]|uniref:Pyruvate formate-lyase n=1 Tax=Biomaibacter acetigenes TaxID=2316383 RepID=A0A3G2R7B0_9FIRM|nr:pyruvate formate lyase family protein [Biomaibacter acetigenes]AYO31330.1 pyruvate formate-lyase [Biomaibacter acetigenes]